MGVSGNFRLPPKIRASINPTASRLCKSGALIQLRCATFRGTRLRFHVKENILAIMEREREREGDPLASRRLPPPKKKGKRKGNSGVSCLSGEVPWLEGVALSFCERLAHLARAPKTQSPKTN